MRHASFEERGPSTRSKSQCLLVCSVFVFLAHFFVKRILASFLHFSSANATRAWDEVTSFVIKKTSKDSSSKKPLARRFQTFAFVAKMRLRWILGRVKTLFRGLDLDEPRNKVRTQLCVFLVRSSPFLAVVVGKRPRKLFFFLSPHQSPDDTSVSDIFCPRKNVLKVEGVGSTLLLWEEVKFFAPQQTWF